MKHTQGEWIVKKSESKPAFNVVGTMIGGKYKIARCPFVIVENNEELTEREAKEAEANAKLISAVPILLKACIKSLSVFKQLANAGQYPFPLESANGGEGFEYLIEAIARATS